MPPTNILGIFLALFSSASWGGGDFCGGLSTRKHNQYAVLVISALAGILLLILCTLIWPEAFPAWPAPFWAMLAGLCGVVGLGSLYKALSMGHAAAVAPTSAVIGAAIPVTYGIITSGLPKNTQVIGFFLALIGIWLVSKVVGESNKVTTKSLALAIIAGVGFGGYYIAITIASSSQTFTPLVISRSTFFLTTVFLLLLNRGKLGKAASSPVVWFTGFFDVGGNVLYILSKQFTRIDIAVILSSLYPAITVLFSRMILKEHISRSQWIGVALCFSAVVLISI